MDESAPSAKRTRTAAAPEGSDPGSGGGASSSSVDKLTEVRFPLCPMHIFPCDRNDRFPPDATRAQQLGEEMCEDVPMLSDDILAEEARLAKETEAQAEKEKAKDLDSLKGLSNKEKVARLDKLLEKSIAYSDFLANKIKKEGEGVVDVKDGSVTGPGLKQPKLIKGTMRPYQLVGVHWLVGLYENGLNGILGDEMGLGKTVQSIAMLAHLNQQGVSGPFMVVGPLSTLHNWHNEFKKWAPGFESVIYHGSKETRKSIMGSYFRGKAEKHFPVMITSYEIVIRDMKELKKIPWKFAIIDEGHRLKNMNCRLIRELKSICGAGCNRLLLTGTPLQNNLTELWSLLNFLLPDIFDDLDSFQAWFDFDFSREDNDERVFKGEMQAGVVSKLHQILRPFLLRRLKADVELEVPKKYEFILFAWMTEWQSLMYADLLKREIADSAGKPQRLQNILMQLRKCCNHPYLFDWPVDAAGNETVDDILVQASGKMELLDRILEELIRKQGDHRVLIFSQMTRMLDILQDYLEWRKYSYCRLDGTVSAEDRMQSMKTFQESEEGIDVFLLSTRAGGLGVNLTRADTVIIFDSDWNPHMDLQAQDRCHRIGQKKTVMVYRLATAATVEEKVLQAAKQKLKLEQLVVSKGKFKDIGEKTDKDAKLVENELKDLLAFDPSKSALGKGKDITDEELLAVLDRSPENLERLNAKKGKGFMLAEKAQSAFDAAAAHAASSVSELLVKG